MKTYDCIIVGGGIAGLSAAIMLGRYKHNVLVIDKMNGRSTLCRSYHNLLGWPDGVSGQTLRKLGREHAEKYGVKFLEKMAAKVEKQGKEFLVETVDRSIYKKKIADSDRGYRSHTRRAVRNKALFRHFGVCLP